MRRCAVLFLVGILSVPFFASAANSSLDQVCVGYTGDPSGSALFDESGDASVMDTYLKRKVLCPSACYDITLVISVENKKLKITTTALNKCNPKPDLSKIKSVFTLLDKPNDVRNCSAGKGLPSVTARSQPIDAATAALGKFFGYSIPDVLAKERTVGPKSRCDQAVTSVIASFTTNGKNGLDAGFDSLARLSAPSAAPSEQTIPTPTTVAEPAPETPKPDTATQTDATDLTKMLTDTYGVPAEQAKALVESDADKIRAMIDKANTNDVAGAQAIARELKLNDDIVKNIAQLSPPSQSPDTTPQTPERQDKPNESTFTQNPQTNAGLPQQCGTAGLAGNIMFAESRCAQINSNPLSFVQGPYHFLCGTWSAYANSTGNGQYADCSYRNDPAVSTTVMNAKMDQFAQQYGSQCTASGLSLTSCQYAIHVFGESGFRQMFAAYQNNPNDSAFTLCGTALSGAACNNNASIFRNGGTVAGVFSELDRRLGGGGTVIGQISPVSSPLTGFTSGSGIYINSGSPFSGANIFGFGNGYTVTSGHSGGYSPYVSSDSLTSFLSGIFSGFLRPRPQPLPKPLQSQVQYPVQPQTQAIASIVAQPQNARVGAPIVVSWSSVGMRSDAQCITSMLSNSGTTTIGVSNEGSKIIMATSTGILRFVIACNPFSGEPVTQATAVAVQ